jgi:NitT/TauT family transport system ATP-binding protein
MKTPAVQLDRIGMTYLAGDEEVHALDAVDLTVAPGEFVALIGPSGCGKSTILRLVADILQPTEGRITVEGTTPDEARRQQRYSFMFQDPVMLAWRNVRQNVELPMELRGVPAEERARKSTALLETVKLKGFENRSTRELSGGMRMRASLARALTLNPPLILMDEPFGALDEITRDQMNQELIRVWQETTAAVMFVTHSIDEAVFLADRVVVLSARPGRIKDIITVDLPRPRPTDPTERSEALHRYALAVRKSLYRG